MRSLLGPWSPPRGSGLVGLSSDTWSRHPDAWAPLPVTVHKKHGKALAGSPKKHSVTGGGRATTEPCKGMWTRYPLPQGRLTVL